MHCVLIQIAVRFALQWMRVVSGTGEWLVLYLEGAIVKAGTGRIRLLVVQVAG